MSVYENETIIRYDESQDKAIVYTASRSMRNKMDRLVENGNASIRRTYDDATEYEVDKSLITIRPKRKSNLTDEQKQALRERMGELHKRASILRSDG